MNDAWDRYGMEISNYVQSEPVVELAERLVALAPGRSLAWRRPSPAPRRSRGPSSSRARLPDGR